MKEIYQHPRFDALHNHLVVPGIFAIGLIINYSRIIFSYPIKEEIEKFWQDQGK